MTTPATHTRQPQRHTLTLGGAPLVAYSRPDMSALADALPALSLIADHASVSNGLRVLVGPSGSGALGVWASRQAGAAHVTCLDTNLIAAEMTRLTLDANGQHGAATLARVPVCEDAPYDTYLMPLPKGRELARLWLLNGALSVRAKGTIYVAGPNRGGIQSFARDAARLLGAGHLLGYRGGNRVFSYTRPVDLGDLPTPFDLPGIHNGTFRTYSLERAGRVLTIYTRPGVFSRDALDEGTQILLDVLQVRPNERTLDLGCGAGVLGLVAALEAPRGEATLVDVDSLAVESARQTLQGNGVTNATVLQGDGFTALPGRRFSLVVSNPPFHSGHDVNLEMTAGFIRESYDSLDPGGRFVLVANRFLTYETLLRERFEHVEILARTSRYQVFGATRGGR